jgi:acetoin utilization deacetylase AcuC-like enzyme
VGASVALVSHADCGRHDTGWRHPEHVGRLRAVLRAVGRDPELFAALEHREARHATADELALAHDPSYVARVRALAEAGGGSLDADTVASEGSWDAGTAGCGAVLDGVDWVYGAAEWAGPADGPRRAFAAVRPPGHHALRDSAMGFCLFGNVAVAALYARARHGARPRARRRLGRAPRQRHAGARRARARRALRVDAPVAVVPRHRRGRGPRAARERVERAHARGLPAQRYADALERAVDAATRAWVPDLVLLSAGFDSLAGDPLGGFTLELDDVDRLTRAMTARADAWCGGRLVSALEGGYAPERLGEAAVAHLRALG